MHRRTILGTLGTTVAGLAFAAGGREARAAQKSGKQDHAKAMHLCVDCGEACSTVGKLVARMSPLMTHTCRACDEYCDECCDDCVDACEKLDDPGMEETIEALKECSKRGHEMVMMMGAH